MSDSDNQTGESDEVISDSSKNKINKVFKRYVYNCFAPELLM